MPASEKDKIIREIAKDLYLREDIVKDVLDRFQDIAVERIVNDGKFRYSRFFTITSSKYKAYETIHGVVPEHYRLSIKLAEGIKTLFRSAQKGELDVSKDNWKRLLSSTNIKNQQESATEEALDWNPLLDEDD